MEPGCWFGLLKARGLVREPGLRIAQSLRIIVQTQDQLPHRQVPIASLRLDELLDGEGGKAFTGVGFIQDKVQALAFQQPRPFLGQNAGVRVQPQIVEMTADQMETKTVQSANVGRVEQRQLPGQTERWSGGFFQSGLGLFQALAEALAHFRRGRLGESHHQNLVD